MASSLVRQVKLDRVELENFKSFRGFQTIGPFSDFTAIIDAGQSNLIEAIMFALGVQSADLVGASQKTDLIYNDDVEIEHVGRKAFVRLIMKMRGDGSETQFTRTINEQGGNEYKMDDRVATWEEYNAKLESFGILVEDRNFLVSHEYMESIFLRKAEELTEFIEKMSGFGEVKKEHDDLDHELARELEKKASLYSERIKIDPIITRTETQKKRLCLQQEKEGEVNPLDESLLVLKKQKKDLTMKFLAASKEVDVIRYNLYSVKQRRRELFNKAFDQIVTNADQIFKQLTKNPTEHAEGKMYLLLEDDDYEPYLHGTYCFVRDPTNDFYYIGDLSPRDRAVAALALIFSIHRCRSSPFLLFEQVDAALDDLNVANLATFIGEMGPCFQSIVISPNYTFYSRASTLLSV